MTHRNSPTSTQEDTFVDYGSYLDDFESLLVGSDFDAGDPEFKGKL
jgi:hypothetical protein